MTFCELYLFCVFILFHHLLCSLNYSRMGNAYLFISIYFISKIRSSILDIIPFKPYWKIVHKISKVKIVILQKNVPHQCLVDSVSG